MSSEVLSWYEPKYKAEDLLQKRSTVSDENTIVGPSLTFNTSTWKVPKYLPVSTYLMIKPSLRFDHEVN